MSEILSAGERRQGRGRSGERTSRREPVHSEQHDEFLHRVRPSLTALGRALVGPVEADRLVGRVLRDGLGHRNDCDEPADREASMREDLLRRCAASAWRRDVLARVRAALGTSPRWLAGARGTQASATPDRSPDAAFWAALRRLPCLQRTALALHYVLALSRADIAWTLGCSEPAAERLLHRARVGLLCALAADDPPAAVATGSERVSPAGEERPTDPVERAVAVALRELDEAARRHGHDLYEQAAGPRGGIARSGRRRGVVVGGATVAVGAAAAVAVAAALLGPGSQDRAGHTNPTSSDVADTTHYEGHSTAAGSQRPPDVRRGDACRLAAGVSCPRRRLLRVDAAVPYTVRLPEPFSGGLDVERAPTIIDILPADAESAGVSIVQGVRRPATRKTLNAEALARWVGSRPFLLSHPPTRSRVAGRTGWQVELLAPRIPDGVAESCNGIQPACWATLEIPSAEWPRPWQIGPWAGMASRMTFVDLPDGRVLCVWAWAFDGNWRFVRDSDRLVRTLRLDPTGDEPGASHWPASLR